LYGDVIQEIDWSVGQILESLKQHDIDQHTMVIFTSDNGPWLSYGNHAGSAGPLREGKGTAWEGGVREPFIARWPGKIPAGRVCNEFAASIDVLPTLAQLASAELPKHTIDGKSIVPLLQGTEGAKSPHESYYYYWGRELHAVRSGPWKLHFPHEYRSLNGRPGGKDGRPARYDTLRTGEVLFNLESDPGEKNNVADTNPDVVKRLRDLADVARRDLGDSLTKTRGRGTRSPGKL
jgi:arylsulfatase A-like enzyme